MEAIPDQKMGAIPQHKKGVFFATNRIEALTDGVFAIVMTLLVLELRIPEIAESAVAVELPKGILELWPKFVSYIVSFVVLGIMWISHHRTFHYIKRSDSTLLWVNLAFLMVVALIPFSTSLIGDYATAQFPFVVYGIHLFLIFLMRFILWTYATGKYRLVMREIDPQLLTRCKLITIGGSVIVLFAVGISFVSLAVAFGALGLLLVYGVVTLRFIRED